MGAVHLTVADLDRSVAYYEQALGLRAVRNGDRAALSTGGEPLLVLREEPGARSSRGHCGLFHFALLLPERADLAGWLLHVARERIPLEGLSDHFVSEAIYLRDPDGHGIEVYWDRPRERWEGQVAQRMTTLPLDVDDLMTALPEPAASTFAGLAAGTTMGHVHLCVAEIPRTLGFYRDALGLGLMAALGPQAAFLSAGGYHHHLGANTWESAGAPPAPAGSARLERATILVPDDAALDAALARLEGAGHEVVPAPGGAARVRDPSGITVELTTG